MAELVKQAIDTVFEIKDVVLKFKRNNEECARICETVETLIEDLSVLQETSKLWHPSVRAAMQRLNNTLVETERKVKGCQNINAVYRIFFLTGHIASKLDKLRKDIHEKMLSALLLTSMSTISGMQNNARQDDIESLRQEMRQDRRERRKDVAALKMPSKARHGNKRNWSNFYTYIYQAKLDNELVAIKKFHKMSEQVKARFLHELRLLQKLQHRNVVELLGFCFEYNESLVVEDNDVQVASNGVLGFMSRFMSKKSMAELDHNSLVHLISLIHPLTRSWIIQGIAKGIRYLHRQNVVHLDLRPENILLDTDDMTPKINNFGKAQQLKDGHTPSPEMYDLISGYEASTKSDVYSFGVILLEIIGRMCATSKNGRRPRRPEDWAKRMEESELVDLFDPNRINGDTRRMAARWCVIVGLLCCVPDPQERPSMSEVIAML
uniref:Protein kinase domain-containing protein n=1 Tax=Setaria italica TaxID=4555 RepID=K3ZLY5_SETIT